MERILVLIAKIKKKIKSLVKNLLKDVEGKNVEEVCVKNTQPEPVEPEASPNTIKVAVLSDDQDNPTLAELEKVLREVLSTKKGEKKKPVIPHILIADDPEWFYDPVNRQMVRVHPGTELLLSDPNPNDEGKVVCYCELGFILVPLEQISELGYN